MSGSNGVTATALPALNPATVVQVEKLAIVIDAFLAADPADADHRHVVDGLRAELRALLTDEAWQVFLRFDLAVGARHWDLAVALTQWGFTEGLRYAGRDPRGGDR